MGWDGSQEQQTLELSLSNAIGRMRATRRSRHENRCLSRGRRELERLSDSTEAGGDGGEGPLGWGYLFVAQIRLQAALLASVAHEGGEGAEAEVIVVLFGELLHGQ